MRKVIEFIVYSNIWIGAGAAGFGLLYYFLNDLEINTELIAFLFFSTLLTYTFQRFEKLRKKERISGPRMEWMIANKILVLLIMSISLACTVKFALSLSTESLLILLALGPISFLYAFKLKIGSKSANLRDIPFIKIILIAIVWAVSCYYIPDVEMLGINSYAIGPSIAFFLYIIGITIPFDIRDLDVDEENKRTIPQLLGEKWAKIVATILITSSALILLYYFEKHLFGIIFTHFVSAAVVLRSTKNKDELYFSFSVDGLLVFTAFVFYLLKSL